MRYKIKKNILSKYISMKKHLCKKLISNQIFNIKAEGIGVVEIILILVVLVSLVLLFKEQITRIINQAFSSITGDANSIIN